MNVRSPRMAAVAFLAVGSLLVAACSDDPEDAAPTTTEAGGEGSTAATEAPTTTLGEYVPPVGDIVGTALTAHVFTTLAGLAVDAGLVEALRQPGPLTVFAPPDSAFAAVAENAPDIWTAVNDDVDLLTAVLTYHVVAGELLAEDLVPGEYETLNGATITITEQGGKKYVNDIEIISPDVMASNGVIHVIDGVLVPPS